LIFKAEPQILGAMPKQSRFRRLFMVGVCLSCSILMVKVKRIASEWGE
jgi:hypothetical protein